MQGMLVDFEVVSRRQHTYTWHTVEQDNQPEAFLLVEIELHLWMSGAQTLIAKVRHGLCLDGLFVVPS
jgi:hypothetical protein